jgi:hypothetical protein
MIRNLTLVIGIGICAGSIASAQPPQSSPPHPEESAILALVDRFMLAVGDKDPAAVAALRLEGGFTITERPAPSGGTLISRRVFTPAGSTRTTEYRERYWDPTVLVRGSIAVVWTPYELWADGKTSHCGIDVFDLLKEQGVWKIANAMWTVEPEACPALRPKDPSRIRPAR